MDGHSLRGLRIWSNFPRSGLRPETLEPPNVSRKLATGVPFLVTGHY